MLNLKDTYKKKRMQQSQKLINSEPPKFIVNASNHFGMLGTFEVLERNEEFFTVFIPTGCRAIGGSGIKIAQHENLAQAEMMAADFNKYPSEM